MDWSWLETYLVVSAVVLVVLLIWCGLLTASAARTDALVWQLARALEIEADAAEVANLRVNEALSRHRLGGDEPDEVYPIHEHQNERN